MSYGGIVNQWNPNNVAFQQPVPQQQQQQMQMQQQQQAAPVVTDPMMAAAFMNLFKDAIQTGGQFDPEAELTTEDFDAHTDRNYWVTLEGSLNDFQYGRVKPVWRADKGKEYIYQRISGYVGGARKYSGNLETSIPLEMTLKLVNSDYPVDIGAIIEGFEGKDTSKDGKHYAFIAPKHCRREPNESIFHPKDPLKRKMLERYEDNSVDAMQRDVYRSQTHSFVHNLSPLTDMMRLNQKQLKMNISLPPMAMGWLCVPNNIVDACIERYAMDTDFKFTNMNNFHVAFERIGRKWGDPVGVVDNISRRRQESNRKNIDDAIDGPAFDERLKNVSHVSHERMENSYSLSAMINIKNVCYGETETEKIID